MDTGTRIGSPSVYPENPDEFARLTGHASDILDFYDTKPASSVIGKIHVKDRKPTFKISARAEVQKAEPPSIDSFGFEYVNRISAKPRSATATAAANAVSRAREFETKTAVYTDDLKEQVSSRFPSVDRMKETSKDYVNDRFGERLQDTKETLKALRSRFVSRAKDWWTMFEQWTEMRQNATDERATVLKAGYESGVMDAVYEHRFDRSLSVQTHGVYGTGPENRSFGLNLRHDSERRVIVGKCSTDRGVVGLSILQLLGLGVSAGAEAFWVNDAHDWSAAFGLRYKFPQHNNKEEPVTVSAAMSKLGMITSAWSVPVRQDLLIASRLNYEVATYNSSLQLAAQWRPILPVLRRFRVNAVVDPSKFGRLSLLYAHSDDVSFEGVITNTWGNTTSTRVGLGITMGV